MTLQDKTAKKRTKGAVNRILQAHKTLQTQLPKLAEKDRNAAIAAISKSFSGMTDVVKAQTNATARFDFDGTDDESVSEEQ